MKLHFVARPVEESDRDGLPLNGRGLLVSVLVDNSQDLVVESRLLPVPDGRGNVAATHTDVVVLTENTPITLQQARSAHQLNSIPFHNPGPVLKKRVLCTIEVCLVVFNSVFRDFRAKCHILFL